MVLPTRGVLVEFCSGGEWHTCMSGKGGKCSKVAASGTGGACCASFRVQPALGLNVDESVIIGLPLFGPGHHKRLKGGKV